MNHRNLKRGEYYELLLVSAVVTLITVRIALHVSGYPRIGNSTLHIAHMLWGGVLMLASNIVLLTYLSQKAMQLGAVMGGVGFGLFIDELGKFITASNDYFFRPALSLIYICFALLFVLGRFVTRPGQLSATERRINQAVYEDTVDATDKILLARSTVKQFLGKKSLRFLVSFIFIVQAVVYVVGLTLFIIFELSGAEKEAPAGPRPALPLATASVVATLAYSALVVVGAVYMLTDRITGLTWFKRATLLNLLILQPFHFYQSQIAALSGLAFNAAIYLILYMALQQYASARRPLNNSTVN